MHCNTMEYERHHKMWATNSDMMQLWPVAGGFPGFVHDRPLVVPWGVGANGWDQ